MFTMPIRVRKPLQAAALLSLITVVPVLAVARDAKPAPTAQPSPTPLAEPTPILTDPGGATPVPQPAPVIAGGAARNFLNLSIDALLAGGGSTASDVGRLQTGGHDPSQRGFTVQNVETVLEGAVDPYFRGQANIILQITPEGETIIELEEAYATTSSLPKGLQIKAGQFFTEFGRLNPQHPHSWDFVDQPLVNGRIFGPDGLRSTGVRMSWLMPTSFYSEAYVALQNSQGETAPSFRGVPGETLFGNEIRVREVKSLTDMLIVPRYAASFDLSDTQTLLFGASGAFGPNGIGENARTRVLGADVFWKWKPTNAFKGFPFVKVQAEWMQRRVSTGADSNQAFHDWGSYAQVNYGYKAGHVLALRVDRVAGDTGVAHEAALTPRWRVSPTFTWFPTEFSKLRLQYNFDHGDAFARNEHSVWLQFEFLLGAHAAHKF